MSLILAQITMNAGDDIPGSVIKWNLKNYAKGFDRVVVVDGHLTDKAKEFYSQFENVEVVDSPWEDSYIKQYEAWYDKCEDGDWILYLDCDEIPSKSLYHCVHYTINDVDIYRLPCVLYLTEDGRRYFAAEKTSSKEYDGQWTKNILIKKSSKNYFRHFGSHVICETKGKYNYIQYPYYHMKSFESFVYNDCFQAFLCPEGQKYNLTDCRLFKMFTQCYKTTKEFKDAMKKGTWPPTLKKFAWDRRKEVDNPVSRLAWAYFILEAHPMPERDDFMEWENVKQYVLDRSIYDENKKRNNYIEIGDTK